MPKFLPPPQTAYVEGLPISRRALTWLLLSRLSSGTFSDRCQLAEARSVAVLFEPDSHRLGEEDWRKEEDG
jgi:hypothetical protein